MSNEFAGRYTTIGEHIYQPRRRSSHRRLTELSTDPQNINWNQVVSRESYVPQIHESMFDKVSLDFYATMREEFRAIAPPEMACLTEAMKTRGVGDPFLHVLLPDLVERDQQILLRAGWINFQRNIGTPQWLWVPETGLNMSVLKVAKRVGYKGVLCAPEQIDFYEPPDSHPVAVDIPGEGDILLLPFDRPFSSNLGMGDKSNADIFARDVIIPRIMRLPPTVPLVGWTDGETFGHHAHYADLFLNYLVTNTLPNMGIGVLGINELISVWQPQDYVHARLRERTAWSCPHGDLVRWHGACPCDNGFNGAWKEPFYSAVHTLNARVTEIIDRELPKNWDETLPLIFPEVFNYPGGANNNLSLFAAKAAALAALTSCGTFFDSPSTSGRINILFARQAVEHMIDAQHSKEALEIMQELRITLSHGIDPHSNQSLDTVFGDLLSI